MKKQGGELFGADKGFDWIKATTLGERDIGGVHKGVVRNSLLKIGVPVEHIKSFLVHYIVLQQMDLVTLIME